LKIGLVIYGHLGIVTGGFLYDRMLVEHFRACGDSVEVFSLPWRTYGVHLLDNFRIGFLKKLSTARVDVLIQDELNHPSLFLLNRLLKQRTKYQIVSMVHHLRCSELRPNYQNALYGLVEKDYLSGVHAYIYNSFTTRSVVQALGGVGDPSVVAYPGRDPQAPQLERTRVAHRAREKGPLRILFVGNLIARKELHTLLSALGQLSRDSWQLDVVGSPDIEPAYSEHIHKIIETNRLAKNVRLHGVLVREHLIRLYEQSQLLAVPSSYEGFGIVYLEAMQFGLPSIAGNVGAAHEIVTHEVDGFLVPPGNAAAVASHVQTLIEDRERLENMSMAALDRYNRHVTWPETADNVRKFLLTLVK
jgi:glycosyltransferase involved in cell wall biosynthesis